MLPTKTLSEILQETLLMEISYSNGHLTSFYILITVHVICPTAELLVDSGYQEFSLKKFTGVQRRKYDTIVKILSWQCFFFLRNGKYDWIQSIWNMKIYIF